MGDTCSNNAVRAESVDLPKLSPAEYKTYNRLAVMMDNFHNHFRQSWTTIHAACSTGKRPSGMSLRQFLNSVLEFIGHLTMHHNIEEQHIFPILAQRMAIFRNNETMKNHHIQIHKGMDQLEAYATQCKNGEIEYRASEMCKIMDGFNDVLWTHLDEEVKQLGAENMRKYWSLTEMNNFRF